MAKELKRINLAMDAVTHEEIEKMASELGVPKASLCMMGTKFFLEALKQGLIQDIADKNEKVIS